MGVAPTQPTPLYLDATVVLDGFECERITRDSRWMAMRYAMIRWGKACATIDPRKLDTECNPADGYTKCLTGPAFIRTRNRLLGNPETPVATEGYSSRTAPRGEYFDTTQRPRPQGAIKTDFNSNNRSGSESPAPCHTPTRVQGNF